MTDTQAASPPFAATNLAALGVLQHLANEGANDAMSAWLHAACEFKPGPGTSAQLTITAHDARDRETIERSWPSITDALRTYAGHTSNWASTTLTAELADSVTSPTTTAEEISELAHRARGILSQPGSARLSTEDLGKLHGHVQRLTAALSSARIIRAGSDRCGDYQMIAVSPEHQGQLPELSAAVRDVSEAIYRAKLGGEHLNNLSPVVSDVTPSSLADAFAGYSASASSIRRVGVLTPGGNAAPKDVLSKLEAFPNVEIAATRVFLGDKTDLTKRTISAVQHLSDQGVDAIVIGFGGGATETLQQVRQAVEVAITGLNIPVYVGIGHHDFAEEVPGEHVRVCTTPADAASLFIAESLEAPTRRTQALQRSVQFVTTAGLDADAHARAMADLETALSTIENHLASQRRRHLQQN